MKSVPYCVYFKAYAIIHHAPTDQKQNKQKKEKIKQYVDVDIKFLFLLFFLNFPYKFQVKDINRTICKGIVGATLEEVKAKSAERFEKPDLPTIHLDSDGTEIDDEEYFQTLEPNTELVAVFSDEHWIDVSTQPYTTMYDIHFRTRIASSLQYMMSHIMLRPLLALAFLLGTVQYTLTCSFWNRFLKRKCEARAYRV